jgi:hypothetical protein
MLNLQTKSIFHFPAGPNSADGEGVQSGRPERTPMDTRSLTEFELAEQPVQRIDLCCQGVACGSHLLDHCRIFLRVLIHLVDGNVDLLEAGRLFLRGFHDRGDVLVDLLHFGNDDIERLAGVADKIHALFDLLVRLCDQ